MAKIYYRKIQRNDGYTIDDVPELWGADVQTLLDADKDAA
ncbi:CD1375 family protein [Sporosarcina sp. FSL K6-1540]